MLIFRLKHYFKKYDVKRNACSNCRNKQPRHNKGDGYVFWTDTTSSKSIPSGKRSIRTKPVVQAVRYAASKAKSWQEHEENSKSAWNSKMHRIFKNGLRHTACRKQSRQLRSRPSSGLTRRSLHSGGCYQDAGMYVMQIFCLKVVVPIFVISNQLEWWCGSKTPSVFIEGVVKLNTQVCIKMLIEKVLPLITDSFWKLLPLFFFQIWSRLSYV